MTNQIALQSSIDLFSGKNRVISESKTKAVFPEQTKILERVAECDKTAVKECLETYGNLVWTLTKKYTADETEAEIAVQEIFSDIWRFAAKFDAAKTDEATFIFSVARRNLLKRNSIKDDRVF